MRQDSTPPTSQSSVSAALAAAAHAAGQDFVPSNHDPGTHGHGLAVRFPGDDGGHSLADVAQRDLDAALQLLADRAQYITGAGGAAIALRRNGKNDLLCRASAGSNAPELGALLSTEYGLSGESVRTRRALRCDDAERDARVNHEVCRELGIASVVVMPVVDDDQVLGVFELFSGKANAFGDRDMSALERLSQMVETAVRMARVAEMLPERLTQTEPTVVAAAIEIEEPVVEVVEEAAAVEMVTPAPSVAPISAAAPSAIPVSPVAASAPPITPVITAAQAAARTETRPDPKAKPLFWSVALSGSGEATAAQEDQSHVPPMMRNLRKCEACGFPVSAERKLCVECEEKKWRGQLKRTAVPAAQPVQPTQVPAPVSTPTIQAAGKAVTAMVSATAAEAKSPAVATPARSVAPESPLKPNAGLNGAPAAGGLPTAQVSAPKAVSGAAVPVAVTPVAASQPVAKKIEAVPAVVKSEAAAPEFVFTAGLAPQQSWLLRNKFLIAAIVVAGALMAGFLLLR